VVANVVSQGGQGLEAWVSNLLHGGVWRAVGRRWLSGWGVDLKDAVVDRGARNRASYRPTRLYNARAAAPSDVRDFVVSWWATLEPTAGAPFETLDRHLLRATFEDLFVARTGHPVATRPQAFRAEIASAKEATMGDGTLDDSLGQFLTRQRDAQTCQLLAHAASHDATDGATQHLGVLSRATLLLRLASGASSDMLARASLDEDALRFWLAGVGEDRALWLPTGYPDQLTDLWGDIEPALETVAAATTDDLSSYRRLHDRFSPTLSVLSGAERVAVWGAVA
jgi:hypothetical protein